ncbi:MAG: hypothetical protein LBQ31_01735 [Bacteroidales bacterium]|jgi:two-component system phosphate regulon sensor histidine kinase PhoR|nr:hypothetical protein [Bacteroidales bacterium]
MKKKYFFTMVLGMLVVMLLLVGVQYYWSQNVFRLNNEYFSSCVSISANKTINNINRQVSAYRNDLIIKHNNKIFKKVDSLGFQMYQIREAYPFVEDEHKDYWAELYKRYMSESDTSYRQDEDELILNMLEESEMVYFRGRKKNEGDTVDKGHERNIDDFIKFLSDEKVVSDLPDHRRIAKRYEKLVSEREEMIKNNEKIRSLIKENIDNVSYREWIEKISNSYIDSILSTSLAEVGINIEAEWCIVQQDKAEIVCRKSSIDTLIRHAYTYTYRLFPEHPYYLYIGFSSQDEFLISKIWMLVFASIILITSQIIVFSYTVFSLGKQKRVNDLRNDFVNHITHELKTPVSTISLICDAYFDSDIEHNKAGVDEYFSIIQHENTRLKSLIKQIFDISKIEKGKFPILKTKFSLRDAINEAIDSISYQVENKNGKIITNFFVEDDIIESDRVHVVRIFSNLIDNANKYSAKNPRIKISVTEVSGGINVDVKDNGIGISKKYQEQIFNTLYRVPTGNIHNVKGVGLGLSYVKSMLHTLGGKISLDSELGKGTCFHVFFPKIN